MTRKEEFKKFLEENRNKDIVYECGKMQIIKIKKYGAVSYGGGVG